VHFLQCVCTYLDVAPPHAMHFHGSRSTIGGAAGRSFELVADGNGIRQETFKIAIRLLNTNGAFPPPVSVSAFALLALSQCLCIAHTCLALPQSAGCAPWLAIARHGRRRIACSRI
jgi:hypothetical protein